MQQTGTDPSRPELEARNPRFGGSTPLPSQQRELDVEILPGGAGTPTVQMVGAGSAEFGIVEADELVLARSKGNPVVALFAVYQNSPLGIMTHAERKLASIGDVTKDGTLAVQQGLPFVRLLEKMYSFQHVHIVPSPGRRSHHIPGRSENSRSNASSLPNR